MNNNQNEYSQNQQSVQGETPNPTAEVSRFSKAAIVTLVFGALMIVCCFIPYYSFDALGVNSSASLVQSIFGIGGQNASLETSIINKAASEYLKDYFIGNVFVTLVVLADVISGVIYILSKKKTKFKAKKASVETVLAGLFILIFTGVMALITAGQNGVSLGVGAIFLCILALAFNFALSKCLPKKEKKQKK